MQISPEAIMQPQFHLWLVPCRKDFAVLQKISDELSQRHGSPPIDPHLSLLSRIDKPESEVLQKAKKLSEQLKPMDATLLLLSQKELFFQCVFWKAVLSKELQKARETAEQVFGVYSSEFMPHISLLYGEFDSETKNKWIENLQGHVPQKVCLDSLWVVKNSEKKAVFPPMLKLKLSEQI